MNPLDRKLQERGHPMRLFSHEHVSVYAANGYVIFRDRRGGRDLYLSRKQLVGLLPKLLRVVRLMDRSIDVEKRMSRQHALEMEHLQEMRQEKKTRVFDVDAEADRQRRRYEAAKRRGSKR